MIAAASQHGEARNDEGAIPHADVPSVVLGLWIAASALMVLAVMSLAPFGLDLTDEGYYLNWIADPFLYGNSATQFGFVYHPLYEMVDGDVVALRRANVALTAALAFLLTWLVVRCSADSREEPLPAIAACALAAAASTTSLVILNQWIMTPSYNWLALQALLVAVCGAVLVGFGNNRIALAGAAVTGIGVWLAFLAKPSTALVLAMALVAYLLAAGQQRWKSAAIATAAAGALTLASALVIDGSVHAFVERLQIGMQRNTILAPAYYDRSMILRADVPLWTSQVRTVFVALACASFLLALATLRLPDRLRVAVASIVTVALSALVVAIVFDRVRPDLPIHRYATMWALAVPLGVIVASLVRRWSTPRSWGDRRGWALVSLLLLAPFMFAFGTGDNYWFRIPHGVVFWMLGAMVVLRMAGGRTPGRVAGMVTAVVLTQLIVALLLQMGSHYPRRQQGPLRDMSSSVTLQRGHARVTLSRIHAKYLRGLQEAAKANGFTPGTNVLDLTGRSPGVLYALGARSLGAPWYVGGYEGSEAFTRATLNDLPCRDIATAWVLDDPGGVRQVDGRVLSPHGVDPRRDLETVARVTAVGGSFLKFDDVPYHDGSHLLRRPTRDTRSAVAACRASRTTP